MAILHVNSNSGSNTSPYDTWATAAPTLAVALAKPVSAGDIIYVDASHNETAGWAALAFPNTVTNPVRILCGTHSGASGIDALATGAVVSAPHNTNAVISGSLYCYGIDFKAVGTLNGTMTIGNASGNHMMFENCGILQENTAGNDVNFGSTSTTHARLTFKNCTFRLGTTSTSQIRVNSNTYIIGGGWHASTLQNSNGMISVGGASGAVGALLEIYGHDFSNCGNTFVPFLMGTAFSCGRVLARNIKMPSGWSVTTSLSSLAFGVGSYAHLLNYGTGDTNYKFWIEDATGMAKDETTIKKTSGGASDGTTAFSWKLTTTANVAYPSTVYRSPPIIKRQAVQGSSPVVRVDIVHNGTSAVTDAEVWLEVEYLGTSGFPISTTDTDRVSVIGSAASQPSSGVAWDGDSGPGPNESGSTTWHQLFLAVTVPAFSEVGYIVATVCMAKPSWTIYVDPQLTVT